MKEIADDDVMSARESLTLLAIWNVHSGSVIVATPVAS